MNVHQAKPAAGKAVLFYEKDDFIVRYARGGRERVQERKKFLPVLQIAAGQFANDHRMAGHLVLQQPFAEGTIAIAQVVDPYGSVDENHLRNPAPGDWPQSALGSAEAGQPRGAGPGDQRLQPHMDEGGFLFDSRQGRGLGEHVFFEDDGRSHAHEYASFICICQGRRLETPLATSRLPRPAGAAAIIRKRPRVQRGRGRRRRGGRGRAGPRWRTTRCAGRFRGRCRVRDRVRG